MIACLLIAAALAAESPEPAIRKLLEDQRAAWNRGDLDGYMAGYWKSPELTFLGHTSITKGWDQTLARYRSRYQGAGKELGKLDFTELVIELVPPEVALVRGRWHLSFASGKGSGGVFTLVLRRFPEGYRIIEDHSSGENDAPVSPPKAEGAVLELRGDLPQTGSLSMAELSQLPATEAKWSEHGDEHTVRGVPLDALLTARGFSPGAMGKSVAPAEKRPGWKLFALASAEDGFQAAFSLAELTESMGPTRALVIWELDGKPLPANRGPLRLVVLTDKEPSRSVYRLSKIEIFDARKINKN